MTFAAVQYVPSTLPDCPISQRGSAALVQSLLATASVHGVVHAANCPLEIWQLKQVSPLAQGPPQAGTNVVQTPWRQVTPAVIPFLIVEPSSVIVGRVSHVHAGQVAWHCCSRLV